MPAQSKILIETCCEFPGTGVTSGCVDPALGCHGRVAGARICTSRAHSAAALRRQHIHTRAQHMSAPGHQCEARRPLRPWPHAVTWAARAVSHPPDRRIGSTVSGQAVEGDPQCGSHVSRHACMHPCALCNSHQRTRMHVLGARGHTPARASRCRCRPNWIAMKSTKQSASLIDIQVTRPCGGQDTLAVIITSPEVPLNSQCSSQVCHRPCPVLANLVDQIWRENQT